MHPRRLVQLTGLSLSLLAGAFIAYTYFNTGKPYRVDALTLPAPTLGEAATSVTLVADLACPHCQAFDAVKGKQLEARAQAGEIQLAYVLVGLQEGGDTAGNAALCVHEQNPGAFWSYKTALYELNQISEAAVIGAAKGITLEQAAFETCVRQQQHMTTLARNEQAAKERGVKGTPTLIARGLGYANPSTATVVEVTGE